MLPWAFLLLEGITCMVLLLSAQEKFPLLSLGPGDHIQHSSYKPPKCHTGRLENRNNFLKDLPSLMRKELELFSFVCSYINYLF